MLSVVSIYYAADGGWSAWTAWSGCSHTCGGGLSTRTRDCDNPVPTLYGKDCVGHGREDRQCNTLNCPSKLYLTYSLPVDTA